MSTRGRELVAADEPTIVAEPFLDVIMVEDREGDRSFSNSWCADESDGLKVLSEFNDLLNQVVASKTSPRRRGML